jgi:hypothetical protein
MSQTLEAPPSDGVTFQQLLRYYKYSEGHLARLIREIVAIHPKVELRRIRGNTRVFAGEIVSLLDDRVPDHRKRPRGPEVVMLVALDEVCGVLDEMGLATVIEGSTIRLVHGRQLSAPLFPHESSVEQVRSFAQSLRMLHRRAAEVGNEVGSLETRRASAHSTHR